MENPRAGKVTEELKGYMKCFYLTEYLEMYLLEVEKNLRHPDQLMEGVSDVESVSNTP